MLDCRTVSEQRRFRLGLLLTGICWLMLGPVIPSAVRADPERDQATIRETAARELLEILPEQRGVVVLLGATVDSWQPLETWLKSREWTIFARTDSVEAADALRLRADVAGELGKRVFISQGSLQTIPLSHNLVDAILVENSAISRVSEAELLRVLRPQGQAILGQRRLVKPIPPGMDDWSHPYHGPDNNTQSDDQYVRGSLETQFVGYPKFSPMPRQTVIAGGRIYTAMGHIAHKANQNEMLNTLLCMNAYNGEILWRRELPEGFMLHRNTMIAAEDGLYLGDNAACRVFEGSTGEIRATFTIPAELTDGPVWKWTALQGNRLFALVGNPEVKIETLRSDRRGIGHWPWGMWDGHDYDDPRTAFGHGRTLVALDRTSGQLLWHHREQEFLDARAVCLRGGKLYAYAPGHSLICLEAESGRLLWRNTDRNLLEAIGPHERAQHYTTGYATSSYLKCTDDFLFFAGPQRKQMVVAATQDGSLQWTNPVGNLQLVLRADAVYAAGPQGTRGMLLDYQTGADLASLPARRACTRATGCADSIFFRAHGGTVRVMTDGTRENLKMEHIAPMRPPCQDGVIVSNGHLYWGPWMCGCELSLYGNIGLRPVAGHGAAATDDQAAAVSPEDSRWVTYPNSTQVRPVQTDPRDWTTYRGDNARSDFSATRLPEGVAPAWACSGNGLEYPTAPICAGSLVFLADRAGAVRAFDRAGNAVWTRYTEGPIYFPPTYSASRLFVGSADGSVHAFEAATGRPLWRYQVAPRDLRIPIFGKLVSRWPVSGGVVVQDRRVYAAAGFTHYDGTHVVALDAETGEVLARNDDSGRLSEQVNSGISLQGELSLVEGELRFPGGGIYEMARYRLEDLQCLNEPSHDLRASYRTAFQAWYPEYNKFSSFERTLPDGCVLCYDATYDGSAFDFLTLETPREPGEPGRVKKDLAGEFLRRRGRAAPPRHVWREEEARRFTALALCEQVLLVAGHTDTAPDKPFLEAMDATTGKQLWKHPLPADTVKAGLAINAQGEIFVTLETGELLCFRAPISD